MSPDPTFSAEGGCTCRAVRYRLTSSPLIVHACHCRWCQRETGSAFVINAMIESDRLSVPGQPPILVDTPSESGAGQRIARCPHCQVALWSHYAGGGPVLSFVRVGTLDQPDLLPPDVHIFTASRQPWLRLPDEALCFTEFYERDQVWSPQALARRQAYLPQVQAYLASRQPAAN